MRFAPALNHLFQHLGTRMGLALLRGKMSRSDLHGCFKEDKNVSENFIGGERGIRTPGALTGAIDFESTPFGLSGISPLKSLRVPYRFLKRTKNSFMRLAAMSFNTPGITSISWFSLGS